MSPYKSLYLHFPFCETKCHYCDFYSLGRERTQTGDALTFETAMAKESALYESELAPQIDLIFFGGGTPSMTPPESMKRAIAPLKLDQRIHKDTEWTMEANPSSIEKEKMRAYRELGVNRVSMGVQSLKPDLLTTLGRVHSRDEAFRALDALFEAGFTNVSTDLICGVPGQSLDDLKESLDRLTSYPIQHLSCYLLTLPKHHKMYKDLPQEDEQIKHLLLIDSYMTEKGFDHYEISNYAKPGFQARHNLNYWKGGSYLGLGPSAHSYNSEKKERFKNVSSLRKYAEVLSHEQKPIEWTEKLSEKDLELEKWMLTLRLAEGFPRSWISSPEQMLKLNSFLEKGLIQTHPKDASRYSLTPLGFALSDQIILTLSG